MARRKARRGKGKGKGNAGLIYIIAGVVLVAVLAIVLKSLGGGDEYSDARGSSFRLSEYRSGGGSGFIGNRYRLEGRVEEIRSQGDARLVCISLNDKRDDFLPLLVPGDVSVNLSRGDTFLFDVECRNGKDAEGKPVKGIFIVKDATSK